MSNPTNWQTACSAVADEIAAQNSTSDGRKRYVSENGPARSKAIIAELDALRARFTPFVFAI